MIEVTFPFVGGVGVGVELMVGAAVGVDDVLVAMGVGFVNVLFEFPSVFREGFSVATFEAVELHAENKSPERIVR